MIKLCALGLLIALVGYLLSEMGWKGKRAFTVLGIVTVTAVVGEGVVGLFGRVISIAEAAEISGIVETALKIVGVGYVFGIASDICTELDERGVAGALTMAGRVEIIVLVFPYLEKIISLGVDMIK